MAFRWIVVATLPPRNINALVAGHLVRLQHRPYSPKANTGTPSSSIVRSLGSR